MGGMDGRNAGRTHTLLIWISAQNTAYITAWHGSTHPPHTFNHTLSPCYSLQSPCSLSKQNTEATHTTRTYPGNRERLVNLTTTHTAHKRRIMRRQHIVSLPGGRNTGDHERGQMAQRPGCKIFMMHGNPKSSGFSGRRGLDRRDTIACCIACCIAFR